MKAYSAFGWKLNTPSNKKHLEEVAYAMASRDFLLRTNGSKGASEAMIRGVERFCARRKKPIEDYLEVYIHRNSNAQHADLPGRYNIHNLSNIDKATKILDLFSEPGAKINNSTYEQLRTVPFLCLGKELTEAPTLIICDVKGYNIGPSGKIINASGTLGICVRLLEKLSPKTPIFNYDNTEHRQRVNKLLYNATN